MTSKPRRVHGGTGATPVIETRSQPTDIIRVPSRKIKTSVQNLLWGRAAGRCQIEYCNRPLYRVPSTQDNRNIAQQAHIYAFSRGGPRASDDWPEDLLNDVENLMLVCYDCHVLIDREDGPERFTADVLREMKRRHEERIEIAADVALTRESHILTYGTYVGDHQALPTFAEAKIALFPERAPASASLIELGTRTGSQRDHDDAFWAEQRRELKYQFERNVRIPIERGEVSHLSVFALAPQPLLIQLGVLLGDITPADVYQRHREPPGWNWPAGAEPVPFEVTAPENKTGTPALVFAISATITRDRITRVLGEEAAVWMITVPEPHNDVVKAREMLNAFRKEVRKVLNEIKAQHGHTTPIHVFPAMPVSLAVEFGRVRMPKADAPWVLYDEQQALGGFVRAFTISPETDT